MNIRILLSDDDFKKLVAGDPVHKMIRGGVLMIRLEDIGFDKIQQAVDAAQMPSENKR